MELKECRKAFPQHYIRLLAFDSTRGVESVVMNFIVNRPTNEPGFALERIEMEGRNMRYTTRSYSAAQPEGERYKG
jgi:ribulose-bisphosphate carboxylase small chain